MIETAHKITDIKIEEVYYGQPAPYADHVTETLVTVLLNGEPAPTWYAIQQAKFLKCFTPAYGLMPFKDERDVSSLDGYARTFIDTLEEEDAGVVRVKTITPYID